MEILKKTQSITPLGSKGNCELLWSLERSNEVIKDTVEKSSLSYGWKEIETNGGKAGKTIGSETILWH